MGITPGGWGGPRGEGVDPGGNHMVGSVSESMGIAPGWWDGWTLGVEPQGGRCIGINDRGWTLGSEHKLVVSQETNQRPCNAGHLCPGSAMVVQLSHGHHDGAVTTGQQGFTGPQQRSIVLVHDVGGAGGCGGVGAARGRVRVWVEVLVGLFLLRGVLLWV